MADVAREQVVIQDFPGLVSNIDPEDAPEGVGIVQVNATSLIPGELITRGGYRLVSFES